MEGFTALHELRVRIAMSGTQLMGEQHDDAWVSCKGGDACKPLRSQDSVVCERRGLSFQAPLDSWRTPPRRG